MLVTRKPDLRCFSPYVMSQPHHYSLALGTVGLTLLHSARPIAVRRWYYGNVHFEASICLRTPDGLYGMKARRKTC